MDLSTFYQLLFIFAPKIQPNVQIQHQPPSLPAQPQQPQQQQQPSPARAAKKMNITRQPFIDPIFPQPWVSFYENIFSFFEIKEH